MNNKLVTSIENLPNSKPDGHHFLIEFFGCDEKQINSVDFWKKELVSSIEGTEMRALHNFFYEFEPKGVTGFVLLSSSHISIHTWPENGYVACDVFTCSSYEDTKKVASYLKEKLVHEKSSIRKIQRGYKMCRVEKEDCAEKVLKLPIYSTGDTIDVALNSIIVEISSGFQEIAFVDTKKFGKCLVIDGVIQTAQTDHDIYDGEMLKKMKPSDRNILILGGGDGYIAERAIAENPKVHVDIADLDVEVVKGCEQYLGQDIFGDKRVKLNIGDALHFMKMSDKKYDGVVCDLTDAPIGRKEKAEFEKFFEEVIELSAKCLKKGGWMSIQSGASAVSSEYIDAVNIVGKILKKHFKNVERSDMHIPSYGESCAFLFGSQE